ncbi:MAG: DUF6427 family protein [Bacteroidota bacterium]|nr:DUF6427 family protein [Bacteroidota bacterium]
MTGIFRANNPLNSFLLFMYGILLKLVWFIHPQVPEIQKSGEFLFNNILGFIKPTFDAYPVSYSLITYLLLFTQAISFNQVMINRKLMQKPNYLPALSYLLITSMFSEWNILSAPLIINTLLIWILAKMTNLYNNKHAKTTLYNIGAVIGICSFLYFHSLAFLLLIIFALLITRPFKIAEWIIPLIGIFTPWYFLFTWLFLTDKLYSFHLPGFKISYPLFAQNNIEYAALILVFLLVIIGGFFVQSFASKQIVQVRKSWSLLLLYLMVALLIPFINNSYNFEYWMLAIVPVSAFVACAFYYPRIKWIPRVFHWVLVGFVIYMEYLKK